MIKRHFHRRNLPHLYYNEGIYFITYCLKNSIRPAELEYLNRSNKTNPNNNHLRRLFVKYDSLLDRSSNNIHYLKNPEIRNICKSSLHYFDKQDYNLLCYCIMPNHIHLVFDLLNEEKLIGDIIGCIKKYSARKSNRILGLNGSFWQPESYDRLVRDDVELYFILRYVLLNPVAAGLVKDWKDWEGTYCPPLYQVID